MASKWDGIQSPKILDAVRVALSETTRCSPIARSWTSSARRSMTAFLTPGELNDLRIVAEKSETMLAHPKTMLLYLIEQTRKLLRHRWTVRPDDDAGNAMRRRSFAAS